MIKRQDVIDSFNFSELKKYLKARLKVLPYVLVLAAAISLCAVIINLLAGSL